MKVFHSFRLDTANYCLWRADERVPIAPKAFDVLRYLVEHSQRLVTPDEILEALWPDTYVNREVVKKYVLEVRKVLGDRSGEPVFIETSPKRGYRFVAPVSEDGAGEPSDVRNDTTQKMVGREVALSKLAGYLQTALTGQRQVIFVTGEAGIGKTTLVDVFQERAAQYAGLRILRGHCVEGFGGKEAYYPILEAFGNLVRGAENGAVVQTLAKRAPAWLMQFASLLKPELKETLQREIFGATRERMVREICEALESITAETPILLILEDLHWVDPSTLDVISALARRRGVAKLVLLGTYRPADVVITQNPLKGLKHDLLVHQLCEEIALERLEESDIAEYLARTFAGGGLPAGLANLIYRHSGGNALFMVTIVQEMVKKDLIAQEKGIWKLTIPLADLDPGVPDTLQEMLQGQFSRLTDTEQRILTSGSVVGERFSIWDIIPTLDIAPQDIEHQCEELADRQHFIRRVADHEVRTGDSSAYYSFRHSLYRQGIYRRISAANRAKFHRIIGERLATTPTAGMRDLASEIAWHFEEGRDYQNAIGYLMITAAMSATRYAHRDSIHVLQHALALVPHVAASAQNELEIRILERIGDEYYALGAMADAASAFQAAVDKASQAGLKAAQICALSYLAVPASYCDPARGIAVCDQALEVSMSHDDPLLRAKTELAAYSCRLLFDAWRKEDAAICASAQQTVLRLSGYGMREYVFYAFVEAMQGRYEEALWHAEAGIRQTTETCSPSWYVFALGAKTLALLKLGRFGEVLEIVRKGKEVAHANGNDPWVFIFREAWLRTLCSDFEGVRELCKSIDRVNTARHAVQPKTIATLAAGYSEFHDQNYDQALEYFAQVRNTEITPTFFIHWFWRMQAQLGAARVWLKAGNIANAHAESDGFLESALSTAEPNLHAHAWGMQARVAIAEHDWRNAGQFVHKALAVVDEFNIPVTAWQIHATAWQFHQFRGDHLAAEDHRTKAETLILGIANSFAPDEPLRQSFLSVPAIRKILAARLDLVSAKSVSVP